MTKSKAIALYLKASDVQPKWPVESHGRMWKRHALIQPKFERCYQRGSSRANPLYIILYSKIIIYVYLCSKAERKRCLLFLHVPEVAFLCSQAAATWLREQPLKLVMPPLFQRDRSRRPVIAVGLQNLGWLWRKFQGAISDQERTCLRMKEDGFSKGIRHRRLHKEDLTHLGFS